MPDEMQKYRARLLKKWERRWTKRPDKNGRRYSDAPITNFWSFDFVVLWISIVIVGLLVALASGYAYAVKSLFGG